MEDKTSSKLKSMLDSKKIRNIIIVVGLIGIGLIFLSNWVDFGSLTSGKGDEAFSVKTYSTKIENDLQTVISKIEGAGKTEVLLTMENSVEYVYLDNSTTKTKEIEPLIRGVLVVCEGGDDPVVVERVTDAVTKALDISTAKVCIDSGLLATEKCTRTKRVYGRGEYINKNNLWKTRSSYGSPKNVPLQRCTIHQ